MSWRVCKAIAREGWRDYMKDFMPQASAYQDATLRAPRGRSALQRKAPEQRRQSTVEPPDPRHGIRRSRRWKQTYDFMSRLGTARSETEWKKGSTLRFVKDIKSRCSIVRQKALVGRWIVRTKNSLDKAAQG